MVSGRDSDFKIMVADFEQNVKSSGSDLVDVYPSIPKRFAQIVKRL